MKPIMCGDCPVRDGAQDRRAQREHAAARRRGLGRRAALNRMGRCGAARAAPIRRVARRFCGGLTARYAASMRRIRDAGADKAVEMKRRELITWLGGVALSAPFLVHAGRAQQVLPVIGFLSSGSPTLDDPIVGAFHQGLATTGFAVGRNVNLAFRIGTHGQFMEHAQELVRRKVAVLVLAGSMPPPRLAASAATSSIPIVFVSAIDPVEAGVVTSLARPGGNITGVSTLNVELAAKRLELLRELLP